MFQKVAPLRHPLPFFFSSFMTPPLSPFSPQLMKDADEQQRQHLNWFPGLGKGSSSQSNPLCVRASEAIWPPHLNYGRQCSIWKVFQVMVSNLKAPLIFPLLSPCFPVGRGLILCSLQKVTQILWHTHNKSVHLTMGISAYSHTEVGVLTGAPPLRLKASPPPLCSHASAALLLDLSLILLQPAEKPDTTKALGPHQFHEQSYQEINHFQDSFKKQGKEKGS